MEDMLSGSSAYLKEDYVKRKFMDTWEELCSLLRIPSTIEVAHDEMEADTYSTPYPEINRRVQRLLKSDEFPDYVDMCDLVDRCNTKHNLGISLTEKMQLSEKLFKAVGKVIKCRRSRDYRAHFGSHLTDLVKMEDDPAIEDRVLLDQLQKSLDQGQKLMQTLVDDFVVKQEVEVERKGEASPQGDSCNEEEEEGEEGGEGEEEEGEEEGEEGGVVCEVESEEEKVSSEDEKPLVKKMKLDPDTPNGVSPSSSTQSPPTSGALEDGGSSHGSPTSGALEDSGSSSIDVGTAEDEQIPSITTSKIIIPDSDSDDVVVISDSD